MTADEPMSTPDSGGLREAIIRGLRKCRIDDPAPISLIRENDLLHVTHMVEVEVRALLAAHLEPVPTPDSADEATVGEREVESGRWIGKAAEPNVEPSAQGDKAELVAILDAPLGWDYGARERANAVLRSDWLVQREEAAFRSGYEAGYKQRTEDAEYEEAEADDDTVGEREYEWVRRGPFKPTRRPVTPPADDANRAPVSGGLGEGEREALWNTIALVRDGAPRTTDDAATDDIIDAILDSGWVHNLVASRLRASLAARDAAWVERMAVVKGERDHAKASQAETWRYVCEIAQTLGIEPDDGHPMDAVDRMTARAEAAESERDTARREAGERIAQAIEAKRVPRRDMYERDIYVNDGLNAAARIARADALTSDDGGGA